MIGRAVLLAVDDSGKTQRCRIKLNGEELIDGIERIQEYGLETNPPIEDTSEVVVESIGGIRDLAFITKMQARGLRLTKVATGEVMLWSKFGQTITLKTDGSVEIKTASGKVVTVQCATMTVTASTKVTLAAPAVELSDGTLRQLIDERLVTAFNAHTHPTAGTGPPSAPTTPLVLANVATTKTKAG
jgi:phage gp45-like